MFFKLTPLATLLAFAAAPAAAQQQSGTMDHSKMNHGQAMDHGAMQMQMAPTAANPFPPAEMRMHQRMMGAVGATADETWIRKMIEHHRGAIEMANIEITRGSSAETKAEARKTIAEQQKDIDTLQGMLRRMGKRAQ